MESYVFVGVDLLQRSAVSLVYLLRAIPYIQLSFCKSRLSLKRSLFGDFFYAEVGFHKEWLFLSLQTYIAH